MIMIIVVVTRDRTMERWTIVERATIVAVICSNIDSGNNCNVIVIYRVSQMT